MKSTSSFTFTQKEDKMLKRAVTYILLMIVSLYIFLIEEFIWDPAVKFLKWARSSSFVLQIEEKIKGCKGGWAVTVLLFLPGFFIWPIKMGALYLIAHGYIITGGLLFLCVKVVATAIFAQLYTILGEECEKVVWFHFCAEKIRKARNWMLKQKVYQDAHAKLVQLRADIKLKKSYFRQRLDVAIRFIRKKKVVSTRR